MSDYRTDAPITADPTPTAEPLPLVTEAPWGAMALYDGDVNSSVLQKLSSYYTAHSERYNDITPYFIVRTGQYTTKLYFGDVASDGTIEGYCTMVTYSSTGAYNAGFSLDVQTISSGSVDLSGWSGYIYSSYDDYAPSPYIEQVAPSHAMLFWMMTGVLLLVICCVIAFFVRAFRRR